MPIDVEDIFDLKYPVFWVYRNLNGFFKWKASNFILVASLLISTSTNFDSRVHHVPNKLSEIPESI